MDRSAARALGVSQERGLERECISRAGKISDDKCGWLMITVAPCEFYPPVGYRTAHTEPSRDTDRRVVVMTTVTTAAAADCNRMSTVGLVGNIALV